MFRTSTRREVPLPMLSSSCMREGMTSRLVLSIRGVLSVKQTMACEPYRREEWGLSRSGEKEEEDEGS